MDQSQRRKKPSAEVCKSSVYARYEHLLGALRSIEKAPVEIIESCESASALANLEAPKLGIYRLGSRNTLFKYGDLVLADIRSSTGLTGWAHLDWIRKEVKALAVKTASARTKKARDQRSKQRSDGQANQLKHLQALMMAQSRAYLWLMAEIRGIAKDESTNAQDAFRLKKLLTNHGELFGHLFDPEPIAIVPAANVSPIGAE